VITPTGRTKTRHHDHPDSGAHNHGQNPGGGGIKHILFGIVETKRQDKPGQPWITTLTSTTASSAMIR